MLLVAMVATSACEKNAVQQIAEPLSGGAAVKFFNFSPGSPQVNFYIGNTKTTAIASTGCYDLKAITDSLKAVCLSAGREATTGTAYGSSAVSSNAWYTNQPAGNATIAAKIAATTDLGLAIANLDAPLADGKFYSFYLSGIYNTTTKTSEAFIVEDKIPPVTDYNVAWVRFVNATSNSNPITLYLTNTTTLLEVPIGGEVAYKAAGDFVAIPFGNYTMSARASSGTMAPITRTTTALGRGRVYTVTARGDAVSTVTANKPALDNTVNQ